MNKFATGMIAGCLVGAAATATIATNNMDKRSRKKMKKAGKRMMNKAEDVLDNIMNMM